MIDIFSNLPYSLILNNALNPSSVFDELVFIFTVKTLPWLLKGAGVF